MQQYIKNYLDHYGLDESDFIECQHCKKHRAQDIHHIVYRSAFGKKRKNEQDHWSNLIALCRSCHNDAHDNKISKETLTNIIKHGN